LITQGVAGPPDHTSVAEGGAHRPWSTGGAALSPPHHDDGPDAASVRAVGVRGRSEERARGRLREGGQLGARAVQDG
ncbi:hypothetical protein R0J90_24510, partial [Micrococcus sp. SIMBA_144]